MRQRVLKIVGVARALCLVMGGGNSISSNVRSNDVSHQIPDTSARPLLLRLTIGTHQSGLHGSLTKLVALQWHELFIRRSLG